MTVQLRGPKSGALSCSSALDPEKCFGSPWRTAPACSHPGACGTHRGRGRRDCGDSWDSSPWLRPVPPPSPLAVGSPWCLGPPRVTRGGDALQASPRTWGHLRSRAQRALIVDSSLIPALSGVWRRRGGPSSGSRELWAAGSRSPPQAQSPAHPPKAAGGKGKDPG